MTTIFGEMNKSTDLSGLVYEPIVERQGDPDADSVVGRLTSLDGKVEDLEDKQITVENEISEKITLNNLSSDDTSSLTDDADPASIVGRIAAIESELNGLNTALENMIGSPL